MHSCLNNRKQNLESEVMHVPEVAKFVSHYKNEES